MTDAEFDAMLTHLGWDDTPADERAEMRKLVEELPPLSYDEAVRLMERSGR